MSRITVQAGFTLLEVVLAVALAMVLMVSMLAFYKQAVDIRTLVMAEAQLIGSQRRAMDLMTEELRSAFTYPLINLGLEGTLGEMRFACVTLPGGGVWIVQKVTDTEQTPPEADLQVIGYRLRVTEDDQGQLQIDGVERTCQKRPTARVAEEGQDIQTTLVAPEIKFLRLRYWDGSAWIESWSGGDLPQAVEIVLGRDPLPEGVEPAQYPYPTFRRVVFIPAGAKPATGGTIIRGLDGEGGP